MKIFLTTNVSSSSLPDIDRAMLKKDLAIRPGFFVGAPSHAGTPEVTMTSRVAKTDAVQRKVEVMHKFNIGAVLRFQSRLRLSGPANAQYRIVGHRPPEDGEPSYRIKSDLENHERIARESELS